jgi:peptidoglycan/LPS O-acetylase OafA/YrhL
MRIDIQALRGIAVLLVMMYHAQFPFISKGYLGVDIFFVLSGFLITRIILKDLNAGQFSFKAFYFRRARRLLPAAYAVFFATSLASAFLLSTPKLLSLVAQLIASLTFTANMLFWFNTNYFAGASELYPLLHVWSLSLEEQFYFVLPFLLFFVATAYRPLFIVFLTIASFLLCYYWVSIDASKAFYLLPSRAWELLFGSVLAASLLPELKAYKYKELLALVSLCVIGVVTTIGVDDTHPRFDALLVCIATVTLLSVQTRLLSTGFHAKALAFIGDISYSLYLIHWPIIAIARNVWIDNDMPFWLYVVLFLSAFPLAYFSYHYIEQPFRHSRHWKVSKLLAILLATLLAILLPVLASIYLHAQKTTTDWNYLRRVNFGFSAACEYKTDFKWIKPCANTSTPEVVLWGDSYAMHLVSGLLKDSHNIQFVQATRSSCTPNLYMAQINKAYNKDWALSCLSFNQSVIDYIATHNIKYVVMASKLNQFEGNVLYNATIKPAEFADIKNTYEKTIEAIRKAGAIPIFVAPPPVNGAEIGECLEKNALNGFYVSKKLLADCKVPKASVVENNRIATRLLKALEKDKIIKVVWPSDYLCNADVCEVSINGVPLYRDYGHYTVRGAELLIPQLSIFENAEK